jgi:uncharacterized membrane protein
MTPFTTEDWMLFAAFGLLTGGFVVGIIIGEVGRRRERKALAAFFGPVHDRGVASAEDIEEMRQRVIRLDYGDDDDAA